MRRSRGSEWKLRRLLAAAVMLWLCGYAVASAGEPAPTPSTDPAPTPGPSPIPAPGSGTPGGTPKPADGPKTFSPINPKALTAAANDMALSPSDVFTPDIEAGEVMEFTITVSPTGMVAGNNILRVSQIRQMPGDPNEKFYEISSKIRSSRLFDMIYKVKIDVTSYMNQKEGYSLFYQYQGLEGSSQRSEKILMDYTGEQAKAYYYRSEDTTNAHRETKRTVSLPGRVQDPLCALYALRGAKMEVGTDIQMTVTTEERNYPLILRVLKIEDIDVAGLGKRKCFRMEPVMRFGGLFTRKGKLWFWVDQETHVPVRLEVEIPVGKAVGTLTRYENSPLNRVKDKAAGGQPSPPANPTDNPPAAPGANGMPAPAAPPTPPAPAPPPAPVK